MNNFDTTMDNLLKNVDGLLSAKTVVGEPKYIGDTVIIPLMDVSFGIAAGSNNSEKRDGTGGGVTGKMNPSAVLIIQDGKTKLVSIKNQDTLAKIVDLIPDVLDKISSKKNVDVKDEEAVEVVTEDYKTE
ncbi:MAG: GerW family sporulation protein [Lachnospiraceae bacterium]|nr:GerW family sporulation protein [Lachnospiraceae bacterium]